MTATLSARSGRERWTHLLEASDGGRAGADLPRRSLVFDVVIMLVFVGMGALLLAVVAQHERPVDFLFVVLVSLPLALRRRCPRVAVLVILAVAVVQQLVGVRIGIYDAAVLFGLYSAVGYTHRRFGQMAFGGAVLTVLVGAVTGWWWWIDRQLAGDAWVRPYSTFGALVLVFAAWALGERLRSARLGSIALAERADQLVREREQQAELAAAAERARIAREMHDVIAHGLSVMIAQADGASYVVEQSPLQARSALTQIAATGREALGQMRDLLGLLRSADGDGVGVGAAPQPDLGDLDALLDAARESGAVVELRRGNDLGPMSALVSLTAYRVVQEGLTNARRHGGAHVVVTVREESGGLRVAVADDGRGGEPKITAAPGYGLTGMRERVAAVGGTVAAGPDSRSGYEIVAWLPTEGGRGE